MQTVDLTPSPRILRMLGKIDFDLWRCIAELIDNSLDGFIEADRVGQPIAAPEIEIFLPKVSTNPANTTIEINDNGPGMSLETLERSLKAGFSNNDPFSKFGLFGMGFNISTARLGSRTEIITTRAGDSEWLRATIDFDQLEKQGSFIAPLDLLPKDDINDSGTKIIVSKLHTLQLVELSEPAFRSNLNRRLGRVYSLVLTSTRGLFSVSQPFLGSSVRILINGQPVAARPHCIWSEMRLVPRGKDQVSAVLPINYTLPSLPCCKTCWTWLQENESICPSCQASDNIQVRTRQVKGWIGIQRFADQNDYGIDFVRNGRKIMTFDKGFFQWEDPVTGQRLLEYPIDMNQSLGGRIVGEIELDHVAVTYQKDAFEKNDPGWKEALRIIRGEGPLGPKNSDKFGYPPNDSPFARFYSVFRRADPGLRDLFLSDNKSARSWADKFWGVDPDYQTDDKWYKAAQTHEISSRGGNKIAGLDLNAQSDDVGPENSLDDLLDTKDEMTQETVSVPSSNIANSSPPPPTITKTERQMYEQQSEEEPELSRSYQLDAKIFASSQPFFVSIRRSFPGKHLKFNGERIVLKKYVDVNTALIIYDPTHPFFNHFEDSASDIILLEISNILLTRTPRPSAAEPWSLSHAYTTLKEQYDQERRIDITSLAAEAHKLLLDLQERSVELLKEDPQRAFDVLSKGEQETIYRRMIEDSIGLKVDRAALISTGAFLNLAPWSAFPRIVQNWPQPFLDGGFWNYSYQDIDTGSPETDGVLRQQHLERLVNLIHDVVWITEAMITGGLSTTKNKPQLVRCAQSLRILRYYKVNG